MISKPKSSTAGFLLHDNYKNPILKYNGFKMHNFLTEVRILVRRKCLKAAVSQVKD